MNDLQHVTTDQFDTEVLRAEEPVLVDFFAEWCTPCKLMSPVLAKLAVDLAGRAKVLKVNVEEEPELAARYRIAGVPTMILFKGGHPVDQMVGVARYNDLRSRIEPHAPVAAR